MTGVVRCPACRKARREGTGGRTVTTAAHRTVAHAGRTCTIGPFATTGTRCGKPAVTAFEVVATGEVFAECACHAPGH